MAVPDFQTLMLPLLELAGDGQHHNLAEAIERMAQEFQLSDDDRAQLLRSGQTRLYNRVGWATTHLKKAGLLQAVGLGHFQLTDRGRDVLVSRPAAIDMAFLASRFPEFSEFRKGRSKGEVSMMRWTRTTRALRVSHGFAGGRQSSSTVSAPLLR